MAKHARRPPVPADIQLRVLDRSRRRCCLCFGLDFDLSHKPIQIAHVDKNPGNNLEDNLAALCQLHHDEYDTTRRQTKGITDLELRRHRETLYSVLEEKHRRVRLEFLDVNRGSIRVTDSSSQLLGQIASAFDEDSERRLVGKSNGIRLGQLGLTAMTTQGDFPATEQAFKLLLHLATDDAFESMLFGQTPLPIASPMSNIAMLLAIACNFDFQLFINLVSQAYAHACFGGLSFQHFWANEGLYGSGFIPIGCLFCGLCNTVKPLPHWGQEWLVQIIPAMLTGLSMSMALKGINVPEPPTKILFTASCKRFSNDDRLERFVRLAHRIASLPQARFDAVVKNIHYHNSLGRADFVIDKDASLSSKDEALELVQCWSVNTQAGSICEPIAVRDHATVHACKALLADHQEMGQKSAVAARNWILAERTLLVTPNT